MCLCLQSPEEDTEHPGAKVIGGYEQLGMGTGNSASGRVADAPNC